MIVAPSILSANFANLSADIEMLERSRAEWIHCDVMDGVFVPNISFGFPVIKAVSGISDMVLDVHLMITDPGRYVGAVRDCGAAIMNVHYEACTHLHRVVQHIHDAGMKAAIVGELDMVLLMSVNPGFGGQHFINHTLVKIAELRKLIAEAGSNTLIEVDGGINRETGALVAQAGADVVVAGSAVFNSQNPLEEIAALAAL